MSIKTNKFGFDKLELTDTADIMLTNENWDILDGLLMKVPMVTDTITDDESYLTFFDEKAAEMPNGLVFTATFHEKNLSTPLMNGYHYAKLEKLTGDNCRLTLRHDYANGTSVEVVRNKVNGTWGLWCFITPPLNFGTEYRTTELWNGNMVYTKIVDCGMLPNKSTKTVSHGISNIQNIIRIAGSMGDGTTIPHNHSEEDYVRVGADTNGIYIYTPRDYSTRAGYVQLWYTKT